MMPTILSRCALAAPGLVLLLAAGGAGAATTPIYKCFDRDLSVLYTDQPCKGEVVEVRPGQPDPAALARLEREREALTKAIERRLADDQQLRLARQYNQFAYAPIELGAGYGDDVTYPAYLPWPYYGYDLAPGYPRDRARAHGPRGGRHFDRHRSVVPAMPRNPGRGH
jgi:hypothetical protein